MDRELVVVPFRTVPPLLFVAKSGLLKLKVGAAPKVKLKLLEATIETVEEGVGLLARFQNS